MKSANNANSNDGEQEKQTPPLTEASPNSLSTPNNSNDETNGNSANGGGMAEEDPFEAQFMGGQSMPKLYLIPQTEDEKPLELVAGTMQRRRKTAVGKGEDDKERLNNIADLDIEDNKNNNSNNNNSESEGLLNSMNSLISGNKKMKEDYMNEFKRKMEKNQRN